MKNLLNKTLRSTRDKTVARVLTDRGFPSAYYNLTDAAWDLQTLTMRTDRKASDPTYNIPMEIFQQYSVEIAKDSIRRGQGSDVIRYLGKNLLTRALTEEEQTEVLNAVAYGDVPHRRVLLNVLHVFFKSR